MDETNTRMPLSEGVVRICRSMPVPTDVPFRYLMCSVCGMLGWVGESKRLDALLLRCSPMCDECPGTKRMVS